MSVKQLTLTVITSALISACATTSAIDTSKLSLVKENHAEMIFEGQRYILDSFIKPFQRPYYVAVSSAEKVAIDKNAAIEIAKKYIKPRGCTTPISLRPDLNQSNAEKNKWLIGIEC